jgi:hypothetical protein
MPEIQWERGGGVIGAAQRGELKTSSSSVDATESVKPADGKTKRTVKPADGKTESKTEETTNENEAQ